MEEEIRFSPINDEIVEGIVTYWYFEEDEEIEIGDDLIEISSAENTYSITSPIAGVLLERCVEEGEKVVVGNNLAIIDTPD